MKTDIYFHAFSFDDGGGSDTRRRAAAWMKETLASMDGNDVLTAQFTEDNTSTTAWIIVRKDRTIAKEIS